MKWSIFPVAVLAILLAATSYADGLMSFGNQTYLVSSPYEVTSAQPIPYVHGYGYAGGYDPFGPQIYSPWNSSRCYNCMGVWAGYGCHEFCGPKRGACRGGKFGGQGCHHDCGHGGGHCTADGCAVADTPLDSAPVEPPPADEAAEPGQPPVPTEEKSANRTTVWPQASALFPVLNH